MICRSFRYIFAQICQGNLFAQRLDKMVQMTGLADPVYVEAFVQYHGNDIMVEFVAVNRTDEVLQKVTIEYHFLHCCCDF